MKKIFYTLGMATAILLTSCAEDKGTSFEVTDANRDENVNPSHIRSYYLPGTAGNSAGTLDDDKTNTSQSTAQAGTNTQQQQVSAVDLVYAYYNNNRPEDSYRWQNYRFSATQRMGGNATDTRTHQSADTANKQTTTMTPASTTADAQGRSATTTGQTSRTDTEKRITPYKNSNPSNKQKKTRLTPEQ